MLGSIKQMDSLIISYIYSVTSLLPSNAVLPAPGAKRLKPQSQSENISRNEWKAKNVPNSHGFNGI
jgi:hypothetical protein